MLREAGSAVPAILGGVGVFVFVCLLWIPFRSSGFDEALIFFGAFFRAEGYAAVPLDATILGLIAIGLAMNWLPIRWLDGAENTLARLPAAAQASVLALGTFTLFAAGQGGVAPFIYFQF